MWIETASGKKIDFENPDPEQIDIEDIGYALSNLCRFNGHCARFFSVAEHSVLVAARVAREHKLAALLHDAHEAYVGDVTAPLKLLLSGLDEIIGRFDRVIFDKYGAVPDTSVKMADLDALATEAHFLMPSQGKSWEFIPASYRPDYNYRPQGLPPALAFKLFMGAFYEFTGAETTRIIIPR